MPCLHDVNKCSLPDVLFYVPLHIFMKLLPVLVYIFMYTSSKDCPVARILALILILILQEVRDESDGCGAKFSVLIVSDKFEGKPLLQRHRY
jgi:hypothetical protein